MHVFVCVLHMNVYILYLYKRKSNSLLLSFPSSVILLGHSMGGIVSRAVLIQPNYVEDTIKTIITIPNTISIA